MSGHARACRPRVSFRVVAGDIFFNRAGMRCFGLTPDDVLARSPVAGGKPPPTLSHSIWSGALSFGLVSVLAYSIWAYKLVPGEKTMFASIAVVYVGLTGLALGRLVMGAGAAGRFALLF